MTKQAIEVIPFTKKQSALFAPVLEMCNQLKAESDGIKDKQASLSSVRFEFACSLTCFFNSIDMPLPTQRKKPPEVLLTIREELKSKGKMSPSQVKRQTETANRIRSVKGRKTVDGKSVQLGADVRKFKDTSELVDYLESNFDCSTQSQMVALVSPQKTKKVEEVIASFACTKVNNSSPSKEVEEALIAAAQIVRENYMEIEAERQLKEAKKTGQAAVNAKQKPDHQPK